MPIQHTHNCLWGQREPISDRREHDPEAGGKISYAGDKHPHTHQPTIMASSSGLGNEEDRSERRHPSKVPSVQAPKRNKTRRKGHEMWSSGAPSQVANVEVEQVQERMGPRAEEASGVVYGKPLKSPPTRLARGRVEAEPGSDHRT